MEARLDDFSSAALAAEPERNMRHVKRTWAAHADHAFMDSIRKVHWIRAGSTAEKSLRWMLDPSNRRHEVSALGYRPEGKSLRSGIEWGEVGVEIVGRTTLAANDMNALLSGYLGDTPEEKKSAWSNSGIPRRPRRFGADYARFYVVDADSMKDAGEGFGNEFIVDNWRPVRIIIAGKADPGILRLALDSGLPVVHPSGEAVNMEPPAGQSRLSSLLGLRRLIYPRSQARREFLQNQ